MRWNAANIRTDNKQGDISLIRRFAWLPTYIAGKIVWLEFFDILQMYEVHTYTVTIDEQQTAFVTGKWIHLSKRIAE
jgi:hypothetical protein